MTLSVIVPVYNTETYLSECLESILNQSYRDFELLLIDDGSTDDSRSICDEFAAKDARIKVIHQQNAGVSAARNCGIENASGEYIAFIDADDTVVPTYLEKLLETMDPDGMVICPITQDSDVHAVTFISKGEAQIDVFNKAGVEGFPFCKLFSRKIIMENSIRFDENIAVCEDILFSIQYIERTTGDIMLVPYCGYNYKTNSAGALHGRFNRQYFKPKHLTEYEALCRTEKYIVDDSTVKEAWELRKSKAAATCMRVMIAADYKDPVLYEKMRRDVKLQWRHYLGYPQAAFSAKLSIMLSALSPRLEYFVWRIIK